jgi:hypothetical protein
LICRNGRNPALAYLKEQSEPTHIRLLPKCTQFSCLTSPPFSLNCRLESQFEFEPVAGRAAVVPCGGWVLIRSPEFDNPTADPAVGFLFFNHE